MAGTGHNQQHIKHRYFHDHTSPGPTSKTPSVCTSTHQGQSMMSSSASPWYHPSAISGDNDNSASCDGQNLPAPAVAPMNRPASSTSLNMDCTNMHQPSSENYGHFFVKKTFHKPTYCHHCVEMLWGLIGQGYYCEGKADRRSCRQGAHRVRFLVAVCNFICHDRCRKFVISPCSSIAPILIKVGSDGARVLAGTCSRAFLSV